MDSPMKEDNDRSFIITYHVIDATLEIKEIVRYSLINPNKLLQLYDTLAAILDSNAKSTQTYIVMQ